jgi:hypothetical protein
MGTVDDKSYVVPPHPRDCSYHFTNSPHDVTWRVATQAYFEELGLPEKALEMFSKKQVILMSFRACDPKVFGFERSFQIKETTKRKFDPKILESHRELGGQNTTRVI